MMSLSWFSTRLPSHVSVTHGRLINKTSPPFDGFKNYRPLSGLSFISKPLERVVANIFVNTFFLKSLIIPINLHTIDSTGHSIETALLLIKMMSTYSWCQKWTYSLGFVGPLCRLCDNRPFHSAWLLTVLVWCLWLCLKVASYLADRMQSVKIRSALSHL